MCKGGDVAVEDSDLRLSTGGAVVEELVQERGIKDFIHVF